MKDDHISYWSKMEVKTALHHARLILQQAGDMENMLVDMRCAAHEAAENPSDSSDNEDDRAAPALRATASPKRQTASPAKAKAKGKAASPAKAKREGEAATPAKATPKGQAATPTKTKEQAKRLTQTAKAQAKRSPMKAKVQKKP